MNSGMMADLLKRSTYLTNSRSAQKRDSFGTKSNISNRLCLTNEKKKKTEPPKSPVSRQKSLVDVKIALSRFLYGKLLNKHLSSPDILQKSILLCKCLPIILHRQTYQDFL